MGPTGTLALNGIGTYWCTYVEDGDTSYSSHHAVSISEFSAHTELQLGRILVSGPPFLSVSNYFPWDAWSPQMKTMSLLRSSTAIV